MFFNSLRTTAFRNLADAEIFTGARDVFLVGENGQGKTNFLEALYFCAYASSFRSARDNEMARNSFLGNGEKDFCAEVKLSKSVNDEMLVKFEDGKKSIFINGSPERRRWFFDQTLSLYDPVYLDDLRRFRRVLKSRNAVLRDHVQRRLSEDTHAILDALDSQFAVYGQKLTEKREKAAKEFSGVFGPLYEEVSGICGITVQYIRSWKNDDFVSYLKERRAADMAAGLSLSGPHRDKYRFTHNGSDFTGRASTGQRRLLALLLRSAQARLFSAETRQQPILLLDDVLLEMDGEKRRRFLSVLPGYDQAFYTFLPEEPYRRYQKDDTLVYKVKEGTLEKQS